MRSLTVWLRRCVCRLQASPFSLDVIHVAIGGELAVPAHDAATTKRGETEKANKATHTGLQPCE